MLSNSVANTKLVSNMTLILSFPPGSEPPCGVPGVPGIETETPCESSLGNSVGRDFCWFLHSMDCWLVVLTWKIFVNGKGLSHILRKITNVWTHQPDWFCWETLNRKPWDEIPMKIMKIMGLSGFNFPNKTNPLIQGDSINGGTPIAGWFISWKIHL